MKDLGAGSPEEFQNKVFALIRRILPMDSERFFIYLPHMNLNQETVSDNAVMGMAVQYDDRYWEHDPMFPANFEETDTTVITNSLLMDNEQWKQTIIFKEFFEPNGFFHDADVFFRQRGKIVAVLTLLRSDESNPFTKEEVALLENIQPFVEYALSKVYLPKRIQDREILGERFELTSRELDVIEFALTGASNKQLIQRLNISLPTLRTHLQKIYAKVGVHSTSELISKLLRLLD